MNFVSFLFYVFAICFLVFGGNSTEDQCLYAEFQAVLAERTRGVG